MGVRLKLVNFEWYEPNMGEPEYYDASGLSAYLMQLAREGFLYEVDNYDASIVLCDSDIELPQEVSDAYYDFVMSSEDKTTASFVHDGIHYIFNYTRDLGHRGEE